MWHQGWRDRVWSSLDKPWDVLIIGGGITGAGILSEAARAGLRVLLVEAGDFASGSSSRSSKLVHGGFRYLKNAQFAVTYRSVREREILLRQGRGLITPLGFLMPSYTRDRTPPFILGIGLTLYDLIGKRWTHRFYDSYDMRQFCPQLKEDGLRGGFRFFDAQTDDARLVLREIRESCKRGGVALNYARVLGLLRRRSGAVSGVILQDEAPSGSGRSIEVQARFVINATGAWADELRHKIARPPRLRRLRGSHLVLSQARLPLRRAVSFWHPRDGRPVFVLPWEGVSLVGTTDMDHRHPMRDEPRISISEILYLLQALNWAFPELKLRVDDVQAVYSGVRPVVNTGKRDPSKESREHVLWDEDGLLTVTGGKLTTFRCMAQDAMRIASRHLGIERKQDRQARILDEPPGMESITASGLTPASKIRLLGRYGSDSPSLVQAANHAELASISNSPSLWAELRWAARAEGVVHLSDLLLRRVRLGLQLPGGGFDQIEQIKAIVQPELGWDEETWQREVKRYKRIWQQGYQPTSSRETSMLDSPNNG